MKLSAELMRITKFGKLLMKLPIEVSPGSGKKIEWVCDCGRTTLAQMCKVTSGYTKTCGKCSIISALELKEKKFGKLRMKDPVDTKPGSHQKVQWICDCGQTTWVAPNNVTSGHTKSCGECSILSAEYMVVTRYGKLRMKDPTDIKPSSMKK